MTTTLVEVLCFLHVIDKTFFCQKCQHTWPATVDLRQKTDVLNWPQGRWDGEKREGLMTGVLGIVRRFYHRQNECLRL